MVSRENGKPVLETFQLHTAESVNQEKYRVLTALQWLSEFNASIRADDVLILCENEEADA